MKLLERILEMDEVELLEYITEQSIMKKIYFDQDLYESQGLQGLRDFLADHLHPEFQGELHSECMLIPGCAMFPNTETEDDLDEALEML